MWFLTTRVWRMRAMRTNLAQPCKAASVERNQARFLCTNSFSCLRLSQSMTCKAGENPVRGAGACQLRRVPSTRLAWGASVWRQAEPGFDRLGDSAKNRAVKSSTMKGATEYVRERLPVRFWGDGAELRKIRLGTVPGASGFVPGNPARF